MKRIGSILHGAYGDYYEQMLGLKQYKKSRPGTSLVLFFASEARLKELRVFDLSFADEVHLASDLPRVPVDEFFQYQVRDQELQADVLAGLPPALLAKIDPARQRTPWATIRSMDPRDPANDVGLSAYGRERLPACMEENRIDPTLFDRRFTVGFLWRYRSAGGAVSSVMQAPLEEVRRTKGELLSQLTSRYGAHVLVCGMNVKVTEENRTRVDAKFTDRTLDLDPDHTTYLKGLSWGLELEILRRCSLCIVMPSGFSEALWIKRSGPTVLVDPPPHYLLKLMWNRMPLFNVLSAAQLLFQWRQPHTAERVLRFLESRSLVPAMHGTPPRTVEAPGRAS